MAYYSSSIDFSMMDAHQKKKTAKDAKNLHKYERFTNEDYDRLCQQDFRSVRYKRPESFPDIENDEEDNYFMHEVGVKRRRTEKDQNQNIVN